MQARSREIKPDFFFSTEKKTPSKQGGYYYPFGMTINERSWNDDSYDHGFNAMYKDDEVKGSGNSYAFEYRIHDPRLGRFLSVDPLYKNYPHNSSYAFSENRLIDGKEFEGLEFVDHRVDLKVQNPEPTTFEDVKAGVLISVFGIASSYLGLTALAALILEEVGEYAFESVTGIPVIIDPIDVLQQAAKKGVFKAAKDKLTTQEKKRAAEYIQGGSQVKQIPKGSGKTADFEIDGKKVEFKALKGETVNVNTGVTRLQDATKKEGVDIIDLDIRNAGGGKNDAVEIMERFSKTKEGKSFTGKVRIATSDGVVTYNRNK